MSSVTAAKKPHAVCIPYPAQGHINPILKFAKILHNKSFHISFVNTDFNHRRLLKSGGADSLRGLPSFQFYSIPDGLPPSDPDATQDIPALCFSTSKNCLGPFRDLLIKLNSTTNVPPVSRIVSDAIMSFTLEAAHELDIPEVLFWTPNVAACTSFLHYPTLIQKGYAPLKDESQLSNGYLDTPIDWIPGIRDIRLKDLPSFIRTTDPNDIMLNFVLEEIRGTYKASALIFNTFEALEEEVLSAIRSELLLPPIYTLGPMDSFLDQIPESELNTIGGSLWKEDTECLKWLDSKQPNSVVYVNFGSITVMTPQQMIEFSWGLANSKQTFLWIIRPDLVKGDTAILQPAFAAEIAERSMITSWCPQKEVLNHPSIGGFLTHCGWNSMLESIHSGVPMICWPFFAEQQTNCRYSCVHWGIGMEIDNDVKRDEVETLVRELMEGKKGKEMKLKATQWKKKAREATAPGGSSYVNLDLLVNQALL